MGKDYLARKSDHDNYETPYSLTEELMKLGLFDFNKQFCECACGKLAIVKVLEKYTNNILYFDKNIKYGWLGKVNFLDKQLWQKYNYIITNPPFSLFDEFVMRAKEIAKEKIAFIGRVNYFGAYQRNNNGIWKHLKEVHVFNRMVDYRYPLREDGKFYTGGLVTGWFVWDMSWNKNYWKTYIMDVQKYVVQDKKK